MDATREAVRRCTVCGVSLEGRDRRARTCSATCRREAARFRAVLDGGSDDPYSNLGQLVQRASKVRANRRFGSRVLVTHTLYKFARASATEHSIHKGYAPSRAKNIIVGRGLGPAGVWRRLWK